MVDVRKQLVGYASPDWRQIAIAFDKRKLVSRFEISLSQKLIKLTSFLRSWLMMQHMGKVRLMKFLRSPHIPDIMKRLGKFDKDLLSKRLFNDTDYRRDDWDVHPY